MSNCTTSIGTPNGTLSRNGSWSTDCASTHRTGRYARFYTFSLSQQTDVQIDLTSATDTYLFLLQGAGSGGAIITRDDDGGPTGYDSRITRTLDPGSYTIEATTYSVQQTDSFTLSIQADGDSTQPTTRPARHPPYTPTTYSHPWRTAPPTLTKPLPASHSYSRGYGRTDGSWSTVFHRGLTCRRSS